MQSFIVRGLQQWSKWSVFALLYKSMCLKTPRKQVSRHGRFIIQHHNLHFLPNKAIKRQKTEILCHFWGVIGDKGPLSAVFMYISPWLLVIFSYKHLLSAVFVRNIQWLLVISSYKRPVPAVFECFLQYGGRKPSSLVCGLE